MFKSKVQLLMKKYGLLTTAFFFKDYVKIKDYKSVTEL